MASLTGLSGEDAFTHWVPLVRFGMLAQPQLSNDKNIPSEKDSSRQRQDAIKGLDVAKEKKETGAGGTRQREGLPLQVPVVYSHLQL